jgi:hypothetical protein
MSPPGRPKGEDHRSAQHEGASVSPPGRPKGEDHRSAQHGGAPVSPPGRPEGEDRGATPVNAAREAQRQQWLLQVLFAGDPDPAAGGGDAASPPWSSHPPARLRRGLQAYIANAGASAERSLAASFPTVAAMLGEEPFAGLARAFWRAAPPQRGDLADWGEGLAGFMAADETLSGWPYLPDSARLDWSIALAERAADAEPEPATLALLGEADPSALVFDLAAGTALLDSAHPVATLWRAHQADGEGFDEARAALAEGRAERALVWRDGWRARVAAVDEATARWTSALLRGGSVGSALDAAGEGFDFERWLVQALPEGRLCRVRLLQG